MVISGAGTSSEGLLWVSQSTSAGSNTGLLVTTPGGTTGPSVYILTAGDNPTLVTQGGDVIMSGGDLKVIGDLKVTYGNLTLSGGDANFYQNVDIYENTILHGDTTISGSLYCANKVSVSIGDCIFNDWSYATDNTIDTIDGANEDPYTETVTCAVNLGDVDVDLVDTMVIHGEDNGASGCESASACPIDYIQVDHTTGMCSHDGHSFTYSRTCEKWVQRTVINPGTVDVCVAS